METAVDRIREKKNDNLDDELYYHNMTEWRKTSCTNKRSIVAVLCPEY